MNILLTDPNYKHTWILASYLHLGGHNVYCLSKSKVNLLHLSRFIKKVIVVDEFSKDEYKGVCDKYSIDLIIPVGFKENLNLSQYVQEPWLTHKKVNISEFEKIKLVSNKYEITTRLSNIGILSPKIYEINDACLNTSNAYKGREFFLKPSKEGLIKKYFNISSLEDLIYAKTFFVELGYTTEDLILQEFIKGDSVGYFAICDYGTPLVEYAHKRIREWPKRGGYSTACAIYKDPELTSVSRAIVQYLNWHGPIMIEFKKNINDGKFYFIEINPKLWGSLELGLSSDVPILPALFQLSGREFSTDQPSVNTGKDKLKNISIAWPFDGYIFHYFTNPGIVLSLLRKNIIVSTGLFRDPLYGILKIVYFPIKFIKEFRL